jgi:signal peptidase II
MNFINKLNEEKRLLFKKKNIYYVLLIALIFILDRYTKNKILNEFNDNTYYINEFINFDLIWNTGIGFGLLSFDSQLFYNLISIIIGVVILIIFHVAIISDNFDKLIYSIIIGGALGNFYDRLILNAVPDFIDVHYNNFHWFTFNIADIFVTFGIIAFIMKGFFVKN